MSSVRNKSKYPWWLRQKVFVIPIGLEKCIDRLDESDQKKFCYIVNKLLVGNRKYNQPIWINVGVKYWKDYMGAEYVKYITQLEDWNILEVNNSWSNFQGSETTKSYRLSRDAWNSGVVKKSFTKHSVQRPKDKSITDEVINTFVPSFERISVKDELVEDGNIIRDVDSRQHLEKIYFGCFNLRWGNGDNTHRLVHTVITCPKNGRKNIILKDEPSKPLFEYDVKSCHPVLLLTLMTDQNERTRYMKVLDRDIYTDIIQYSSKQITRDEMKKKVCHFTNGKIENVVFEYFKDNFPIFTHYLMNTRESTAQYLQSLEADIMVRKMSVFMKQHSVMYFPQYDGWIGVVEDEQVIIDHIIQLYYERTGYKITITKEQL